VTSSPIVRRPRLDEIEAEPSQGGWFAWYERLSRAERERIKERLAIFTLSGVLAFALLLVGGVLFWDKVIVARRPVLRVDGQVVTLKQYADILAYRQNALLLELEQVQQLASQASPAGSSASDNFLAQYARQRLSQIQNQLAGLSTHLVEDLIDETLIRQEAARRNLVATPEEVDRELKQLIGYQEPSPTPVATPADPGQAGAAGAPAAADGAPTVAPTQAPTATARAGARRTETFNSRYREYLRLTAGTDAIIRQDVTTQILRRKLNEALAASVPDRAEQVHARHILLPDETAAQAALERLKNGESFEALAAELSTDTSNKDQGGDLGWFPRGVMVKEFEDAAFALQPGQVSGPVKTPFGAHLIRVDERAADRELDPSMLESLKAGALSRWLDEEKPKHQIERYLDASMQEWALKNGRQPAAPRRLA
jgi:parvulin-like peptidyl-prolyl isomerase